MRGEKSCESRLLRAAYLKLAGHARKRERETEKTSRQSNSFRDSIALILRTVERARCVLEIRPGVYISAAQRTRIEISQIDRH